MTNDHDEEVARDRVATATYLRLINARGDGPARFDILSEAAMHVQPEKEWHLMLQIMGKLLVKIDELKAAPTQSKRRKGRG